LFPLDSPPGGPIDCPLADPVVRSSSARASTFGGRLPRWGP